MTNTINISNMNFLIENCEFIIFLKNKISKTTKIAKGINDPINTIRTPVPRPTASPVKIKYLFLLSFIC